MCTCGPSDTPEPADDPESRLAWSDPEWYFSAGAHYRDLSAWLKEVARRCRLPNHTARTSDPRPEIRAAGSSPGTERAPQPSPLTRWLKRDPSQRGTR